MNIEKWCDPADFAKAGLLCSLCRGNVLNLPLMMLPMFTDSCFPNCPPMQKRYETLLGGTILNSSQFFKSQGRCSYISNAIAKLNCNSDLFIDPCTGIRVDPPKKSKKHIEIDEVKKLLGASERIVIVYQDKFNHNGGPQTRQMDDLIKEVSLKGMKCFAYFNEGLRPNLVFICNSENTLAVTRLDKVRDYLTNGIGVPPRRLRPEL